LILRFDVFVARKLGVPGHEKLAMGAIPSGGVRVLNSKVLNQLSNAEKSLREASGKEEQALKRRALQYREGREFRPIEKKTVILVDNCLATGATMRAATIAIKQLAPSRRELQRQSELGTPVRNYEMKQMKSPVQARRTRFTRFALPGWCAAPATGRPIIATFLRPPMTKCAS
jgi:hypothetical protein